MLPAASIDWPITSVPPPLEPRSVHVWGWLLDGPSSTTNGLARFRETPSEVLPSDEIARANRFVSAEHGERFLAAHLGLRLILSRYLDLDPAAIAFARGKDGKPRPLGDFTLKFNLSHSKDVALLAVSDNIELGIDVEFIRPITEDIAGRFFSPLEVAALAALPAEDREAAFYACWTRKEAFLKGLGTGVSGGLDTFTVSLPGEGLPKLADHGSGLTSDWNLAHLAPTSDYIGALAFKAAGARIHCCSARF